MIEELEDIARPERHLSCKKIWLARDLSYQEISPHIHFPLTHKAQSQVAR